MRFVKTRLAAAVGVAFAVASPVLVAQEQQVYEEVLVRGHIIEGERAALAAQRDANNIMSVISADGIGKLPDYNAAEAVQRVPGVSIERDQGEGRFVAVRGLPSQWSSTTLNGDRLPTAEEETTTRATAFDFFPTELIERIEVSKALLPDQEGDAVGGQVNFITKTAPDALTINAVVAKNYNEKTAEWGQSTSVLYGDRSEDERFGWILNGTVWERDWATDNFEPRRGSDGVGIRRLELRDYVGTRETYGLNAAGEFTPDENNKYYLRAQYGQLLDDETHYKHRYRFDKDRVEVQHIHNELVTEFTSFEIGGEHFSGETTLDWKVATAENAFYYGDTPNSKDNSYFVARFDQKNVGYVGLEDRGSGNYSYNTVDGGSVPGNRPSTHLPDGFAMDPTQTTLAFIELYKIDVTERDKLVAGLNYEFRFNDDTMLKFGGKYRDKERQARFADEFYAWDEASGGPTPTLADFSLRNQPGRSGYDVGNGVNYHRDFSMVASMAQLERFWNNNREHFVLVEDESALVSNGGALGRNFDVDEDQYHLYGMATWEADERWTVTGGLRLERTETQVKGQLLEQNNNSGESNLVPSVGEKSYTSVLPQLHVRYEVNDDLYLRGALTRSFARPDFGDLSPGGTYSEHDGEFSSGNPDLNPTYANNLDLMVEWYSGELGMLSGGLFYKDITDPIFQSASVGQYKGTNGVVFFRPENGDDARLWGAELAYVRQFDFLPGFLRHVGVNANLTVMDSEMRIPGRADKVQIPGQADLLYNMQAYYDDGRIAVRVAMNYKGEYIEEHGSRPESDSYYGEYSSVDVTASWTLNDHFVLFAELNNITDEPLKYYLGSEGRPLQVEYYGSRGQLGLRYSF